MLNLLSQRDRPPGFKVQPLLRTSVECVGLAFQSKNMLNLLSQRDRPPGFKVQPLLRTSVECVGLAFQRLEINYDEYLLRRNKFIIIKSTHGVLINRTTQIMSVDPERGIHLIRRITKLLLLDTEIKL